MKIKDQMKTSERFSFHKCGEQRLVLWHRQPSDCSRLHQLGWGKAAANTGGDCRALGAALPLLPASDYAPFLSTAPTSGKTNPGLRRALRPKPGAV